MSTYLDIPQSLLNEHLPLTSPLAGRRVLLLVCGSIAAPKSALLASGLVKAGAEVDVVLSTTAQRFIGPWAFEGVTAGAVITELGASHPILGSEPHVQLARRADLAIVYPASATTLGAIATGTPHGPVPLVAMNVSPDKLILAPAMSSEMWAHPSTRGNVETLRGWGAAILGPASGRLASGALGAGRLIEPAVALQLLRAALGRRHGDLRGIRVVVSAGGNREPIDDVRWLGNRSSGRQGHAIAEAARDRGAEVTLLTSSDLEAPLGLERVVRFTDFRSLKDALHECCREAHVYVGTAAVADFRPKSRHKGKLDRSDSTALSLTLIPNEDLLASLSAKANLVKVAFAAEGSGTAEEKIARAAAKLKKKGAALIALNDVSAPDAGFAVETNRIVLLHRDGRRFDYPAPGEPAQTKYDIGHRILDHVRDEIMISEVAHR